MKTKSKLWLMLIASVGILTVNSCKKEEKENIETFQENVNLLVSSNWRLETFTVENDTSLNYNGWSECLKDNILTFATTEMNDQDAGNLSAKGTWTVTEGTSTCNPSNPVSISGTWEFTMNSDYPHSLITDKMIFNGTSGEIFHMVYELSSNKLKLEWDSSDGRAKQTWIKN